MSTDLHPFLVDWNRSIEHTKRYGRPEEQEEILCKVGELRALLGENFLLDSMNKGFPEAHAFKMLFNWHPNIVRGLHHLLTESATGAKGVERVIHQFAACRNLPEMKEALSLLRSALLFRRGFSNLEFIFSVGQERIADLSMRCPGVEKDIFVEVSEMNSSEKSVAIAHQIDLLFNPYQFGDLRVETRGSLERVLSDSEVDSMHQEIQSKAPPLLAEVGVYSLKKTGAITLIIFKHECQDQAARLAQETGIYFEGTRGPSEKLDILRVHGKIKKEIRQMPYGTENIILLWGMQMLLPVMLNRISLQDYLASLIACRPHLSGLILAAEFPNDSFDCNVNPDVILVRATTGMLFAVVPVFKEGKEKLRDGIVNSLLQGSTEIKPSV